VRIRDLCRTLRGFAAHLDQPATRDEGSEVWFPRIRRPRCRPVCPPGRGRRQRIKPPGPSAARRAGRPERRRRAHWNSSSFAAGHGRLTHTTRFHPLPSGVRALLPDDYIGPRHVATVRQIPPEELPAAERAESWFDWEERPGPEPASNATGPDDGLLIHVRYVETAPAAARHGYR